MGNQHRKINVYREFNEEDIAAMNAVKEQSVKLSILIDTMADIIDVDRRWLDIGKTDIQKGLMALIRSVTKPEFF